MGPVLGATGITRLVIAAAVVAALNGCGPNNSGGNVDASTPDGAPVADAAVVYDATPPADASPPAEIGEPCTMHSECAGGFCVQSGGAGGGLCSQECTADSCPNGWSCRTVTIPGATVDLCIPVSAYLCNRCTANDQCPGGKCLQLDNDQVCASACTVESDCPTGYTCAPDGSGINTGSFCQPITASCSCDDTMDGASRTCAKTNLVGTCFGTQTCNAATGWSACTASTPATETCDGVDNDCNFVIDDGVGGGDPCTNTNANGSCAGVTTCAGASGFVCQGPTPAAEACNFIDDNCDGNVDEAFTDLGNLCSAGQGACLAFGAMTCKSDGTGTECSAVAGTPTTESCNGVDDDCMGDIDEDFPTLGDLCSAGVGECERLGTVVCKSDGTGTECSATPGMGTTETCNYADDDCNGKVDDGWKNTTTGLYDADDACGSCEINCTTLYAAPNATGVCVVSGTPQCALSCNSGTFDLNGSTLDGCEFVLDTNAIYVSTSDPMALDDAGCGLGPINTGGGHYPCRTIAQGLARAQSTGRANVRIADGTYDEAVTLVNGKNLYGAYRPDTWERHLATTATVIEGVSSTGNHDRTVIASNITSATTFEGFVVRGSFNTKPGGNSYAIYVSNSNGNLHLVDNVINAGRGGQGAPGATGGNGTAGVNGGGGADAFEAAGSGTCNASNNRQFTNRGSLTCGGDNVSGGNGGGNTCPPVYDTENSSTDGFAGQAGGVGGSGGTGGDAGNDGDLNTNGTRCTVPSNDVPAFGEDGNNGGDGINASGVTGCSSAAGTVSGGHWVSGGGNTGISGANGGGGGGGGAGGGGDCTDCPNNKDILGAHGGGGGSGGCGGAGGGAGGGGGGVFGIFISGGSAPVITGTTINRGSGGNGGNGGLGGSGGLGGVGGPGGNAIFCGGKSGRGGDGGNGGFGSGGGGGCGGGSWGIYTSGIGSPNYCQAAANNTINGGGAGSAGQGGLSGGTAGGNGQPGILATCAFN